MTTNAHMEAGGLFMSHVFLYGSPPCLRQGLLLNLELTGWVRLADHRVPGICLSAYPSPLLCFSYRSVSYLLHEFGLEAQTQVLKYWKYFIY